MTSSLAPTPDLLAYNERQLLELIEAEPSDDSVVIDLTEAEPVVVINSARKVTPPPADPSDGDDPITRLIRVALNKALEEA